MPSDTSFRRLLPNKSIPFVRIARYACYALVVLAVGILLANVVFAVLDAFTGIFYQLLGSAVGRLWADLLDLIRETVRVFTLLVALGVFLTQFE